MNQFNTNIKSLKKAWSILRQYNLEGMLEGGEIRPSEILKILMDDNNLINDFFNTIVKSNDIIDYEEYDIAELKEILTAFFLNISDAGSNASNEQNQVSKGQKK